MKRSTPGKTAAFTTIALACIACCAAAFALPAVAVGGVGAALVWLGSKATDTLAVAEAGKVSLADVKAMIDGREDVHVFDANPRKIYLEGHLPGARWIQYDEVTVGKLPESKDAKLVFYCYNPLCGASPMAAKQAVNLGYHNVWLMPEGISGWRKAKLPVVSGAMAR